MQPVPCTIVTGFLGVGKTSLIKHLLHNCGDLRLGLIINEFGDIGIDGCLLDECSDDSCVDNGVIELSNGCLCCTVGEDFIPAIRRLLSLPRPPSHILIETSGLALPQPLIRAFNWPDIKGQICIDAVIAVVDTPALLDGRFASDEDAVQKARRADLNLNHETTLGELFHDQLVSADIILLNKSEGIAADIIADLKSQLNKISSVALRFVETSYGRCEPEFLLGLSLDSQLDLKNRLSLHEQHHYAADEHDGESEHEHDHSFFETFVLPLDKAFENKDYFIDRFKTVLSNPAIYRVKGFIWIKNKTMPLVIQAAGTRLETYFKTELNNDIKGALVFIGRKDGFDADFIRNSLCSY